MQPGPTGRFIMEGEGMENTTLIFEDLKYDVMKGHNVYRTTIKNLHLTRGKSVVTQGHVVSVSKGQVVLDIEPGFPTPLDIFNPLFDQGRYLRRYTDDPNPELIVDNNDQIPWSNASHLSHNQWVIYLKQVNLTPLYNEGDYLGVKSKCCTSNGGSAYFFCGGEDIAFEYVKWTRQSRGVLRCGINKIRFSNCKVEKEPPINGQGWCLATSGGGPQIGQPNDPPVSDVLIENHYSVGTGDDGIGFFNVDQSGKVIDSFISDSFAAGILLHKSPNVTLTNNTFVRCGVVDERRMNDVYYDDDDE